MGPSRPVRAEWGWGGVGKDRPRGAGSGQVGPSRAE